MKKYYFLFILFITSLGTSACPFCEKAQPRLLRGITHGAGPENNWDYIIAWAAVIVVLFTLFFSIKWLIRPGEKTQQHIKRQILHFE